MNSLAPVRRVFETRGAQGERRPTLPWGLRQVSRAGRSSGAGDT